MKRHIHFSYLELQHCQCIRFEKESRSALHPHAVNNACIRHMLLYYCCLLGLVWFALCCMPSRDLRPRQKPKYTWFEVQMARWGAYVVLPLMIIIYCLNLYCCCKFFYFGGWAWPLKQFGRGVFGGTSPASERRPAERWSSRTSRTPNNGPPHTCISSRTRP